MSDIKERLLNAAKEIREQGELGWGNVCNDAADHIAQLEAMVAPDVPTAPMLDAAVAFGLNVSITSEYTWSDYMRELYISMMQAHKRASTQEAG